MRDRSRNCTAQLALLTLAWSCAPTSHAEAQGAGASPPAIQTGLVVRRNGELIADTTLLYADVADCGGDAPPADGEVGSEFAFSVTYEANVPVVEAWLGVGDGEDCSKLQNRLGTSSTNLTPACTFLGIDDSNTRSVSISVKGSRLFNQHGWSNPTEMFDPKLAAARCDALAGDMRYTVYLIPLSARTSAVTGGDPITVGSLSTLRATFTPYTKRPDAPTMLVGQAGERELGVSFTAPPSAPAGTRYRAYFDVSGRALDAGSVDAGVGCGSGALEHNALPPAPSRAVRMSLASDQLALKLTDLADVGVGTEVAVAAVSIDPAGNQSRLSDPVCVTHVTMPVFLDPASDHDDSCSLSPGRAGRAGSALWSVLAALVLLSRRARRRRDTHA